MESPCLLQQGLYSYNIGHGDHQATLQQQGEGVEMCLRSMFQHTLRH